MSKQSEARALRRHHRERLKAARRLYWGQGRGRADKTDKALGKVLATPAICSCALCGNPRKYFAEPTIQELRSDEALRDDIES